MGIYERQDIFTASAPLYRLIDLPSVPAFALDDFLEIINHDEKNLDYLFICNFRDRLRQHAADHAIETGSQHFAGGKNVKRIFDRFKSFPVRF